MPLAPEFREAYETADYVVFGDTGEMNTSFNLAALRERGQHSPIRRRGLPPPGKPQDTFTSAGTVTLPAAKRSLSASVARASHSSRALYAKRAVILRNHGLLV
ncbi:MAG: hypothetical protein FJX62_25290 [Alphaproteobacteria bacterium]|nr:hypothetical protein [Alphaproteobacteria bacterium]